MATNPCLCGYNGSSIKQCRCSPLQIESYVGKISGPDGQVTIGVYDVRGARVATLLDETKPAGAYTIRWEAEDEGGDRVGSGVYFVRLTFGTETRCYKLVLLQ